jgi:hypothetical protein
MEVVNYSFVSLFEKVKFSNPSRIELNYLIAKSYTISVSFLKAKFSNNLTFLKSGEYTLEDIAMDAIVPLFVENSSGEIGLKRSLSQWNDKIESECDANYFLTRVIWKRVDQTVTKILKERDPIFEKILKTLKVCIQNNNYKKTRYFGTVYVLEDSDKKIEGRVIDEESFNKIPAAYFGYKQSELFDRLFEYIKSSTDCCPAIPLNLLVKRIKHNYTDEFAHSQDFINKTEENIHLKDLMDSSLENVKEKLDVYYVANNKLSRDDAELIYQSFNDISKDMLNGGMHDGLYSYLKYHKSSLSREDFYSDYHHIMKYLFNRFKSKITLHFNI